MAERIFATGTVLERIQQELDTYRTEHDRYVKDLHPLLSLVTLETLAYDPCYAPLASQSLLAGAFTYLAQRLSDYEVYSPLDPARVWVGISTPLDAGFFGGFYHPGQGYRYLQQIAVVSLSGSLSCHSVNRTLRTLELLRAYAHDTLHHHTYRLFLPAPVGEKVDRSFYRFQYGINFRRWNGQSYSAKDAIPSRTTRNLGNIMEAATDRFAHEFVLAFAEKIGYQPSSCPIEDYIYRDCTGQLTWEDIARLRAIEKGLIYLDAPPAFQAYLRNMRLFVQYVTMRYRAFLAEWEPEQQSELHVLILKSMLSGKMKALCRYLDEVQEAERSFPRLFKTPEY